MIEPLHPVISIGGAPSSGTTLLADLIDSIPGAACDPELGIFSSPTGFGWAPSFVEDAIAGSVFDSKSWYSAPRTFFNYKYLELVELNRSELDRMIAESASISDFVDRYRRHRSQVRGREITVFAEKTPTNIATATHFLDHFPRGLFIHVVRDPRENVASFVSRGFGIAEATATWCQQVGRGAAVHPHPRSMTVRYEDLVDQPFEIACQIADRVGLSCTPDEVRTRFNRNEFRASLPRVKSWRASEPQFVAQLDGRTDLNVMDTGWIERQSLWWAKPDHAISYLSSVSQLAGTFGYSPRVVAKARFDLKRLGPIFRQFLSAREAFDNSFCVTETKSLSMPERGRLPKSTPRDWRVYLDASRPWVNIETLHQIAFQATIRAGDLDRSSDGSADTANGTIRTTTESTTT